MKLTKWIMNYKFQKKENWDCELKAMQTTVYKL